MSITQMLNSSEVTGRTRTHVVQVDFPRFAAQPAVVSAFLDLRAAGARDGFDIEPISSFRDYKTQLRIWNHKFSGQKPLFSRDGVARDFSKLAEPQIVRHILEWSALPGASRHHWGTEIDVIDRTAITSGYRPQLLPQEVEPGGVFHPLHVWLDENIADYGFFRPYKRYQGGVFEEPWHLSYAPASLPAIGEVSVELLFDVTKAANILGKAIVLDLLPEIYEKHVLNYNGLDEQ